MCVGNHLRIYPYPLLVKKDEDDIPSVIKQALAIEPYREGKISLGKAAELAGARNKWEMLMILNEHDIPIHYTAKDAKNDLETLKKFLGK